ARLDAPTSAGAALEMARLDRRAISLAETLTNEKEGMTTCLLGLFRHPRGETAEYLVQMMGPGVPIPAASHWLSGLWYGVTPKRRIIDNVRGYMDALAAEARQPFARSGPPPPIPTDPV